MAADDAAFGDLLWHDGFLAWKGEIAWPGTDRVEVLLADNDLEAVLPAARQSLEWVQAHEPEIRRAVAAEFLTWCNNTFAPACPIGEEEFLQTVELHQLRLESAGGLSVLYSDRQMFGGLVYWAHYAPDKQLIGFSVD